MSIPGVVRGQTLDGLIPCITAVIGGAEQMEKRYPQQRLSIPGIGCAGRHGMRGSAVVDAGAPYIAPVSP